MPLARADFRRRRLSSRTCSTFDGSTPCAAISGRDRHSAFVREFDDAPVRDARDRGPCDARKGRLVVERRPQDGPRACQEGHASLARFRKLPHLPLRRMEARPFDGLRRVPGEHL